MALSSRGQVASLAADAEGAKVGGVRNLDGRRNAYSVRTDLPLSRPNQRDIDLGSLLNVLLRGDSPDRAAMRSPGERPASEVARVRVE